MENQSHTDALIDPAYRAQLQGLRDMTAAIDGKQSKPVVLSTDPDSVLNQKKPTSAA